jgi:hypothetical protein
MAHHSGQLRFVVHRLQQAGVDKHRPAGKGEGVNRRIGDQLKRKRKSTFPRFSGTGKALPYPIDIVREKLIVHDDHVFANLRCVLLTELNVLLLREQVEPGTKLARSLGPDKEREQNRNDGSASELFHDPSPTWSDADPPPTKCTISS